MRPRAMEELQAASAVGQGKLYRIYDELLQARGVRSAQVLLTFFDMSARTHYLNARHTLRKLLDWHVVPVINENDTTTTDEISFGDNDFLAAQVAILIGAEALVLLTDTGGLYTGDPRSDPTAELIATSTSSTSSSVRLRLSTSRSARAGCARRWWRRTWRPRRDPVVITSGTDRAAGRRPLGRTHRPRFHPQARARVELQAWLKYAKPTHGRLVIDEGAERAPARARHEPAAGSGSRDRGRVRRR